MTRPTLKDLHEELRQCQRRLGTGTETPEDFQRALQLAHEINNRLTAELMRDFERDAASARGPISTLLKRYFK
jgi:hypothetical protein